MIRPVGSLVRERLVTVLGRRVLEQSRPRAWCRFAKGVFRRSLLTRFGLAFLDDTVITLAKVGRRLDFIYATQLVIGRVSLQLHRFFRRH